MVQQIVRSRLRIPRTHSKAGADLKEWCFYCRELQGESGESQAQPMTLETAPTLRAEGRDIPKSTEVYWCNTVYSYRSGCVARKTDWWLLECWFEEKFVRFVERTHEIYFVDRKASKRMYVVWWEDWQKFKWPPDQILFGQKYGQRLVKPLRI